MIIDIHGHITAPLQLGAYQAGLFASRGAHARGSLNISDEQIEGPLGGYERVFSISKPV